MKYLLGVLSLLLLMIGCSSSDPNDHAVYLGDEPTFEAPHKTDCGGSFKVTIERALADEHLNDITSGVREWQRLLKDSVRFEVSVDDDTGDALKACEMHMVWTSAEDDTTFATASWVGRPTYACVIEWNTNLLHEASNDRPDVVESITLHEMGHCLGLDHNTDRTNQTVMWPYITVPPLVGCEDVRRACAIWHCTPACEGSGWAD